jgi:hypothetical protein
MFKTPKTPQIQFADDSEVRRCSLLIEEFVANVLFDEEPLFISDEASVWDISLGPSGNELIERCQRFYGVSVSSADLKMSVWRLVEKIDRLRTVRDSNQE